MKVNAISTKDVLSHFFFLSRDVQIEVGRKPGLTNPPVIAHADKIEGSTHGILSPVHARVEPVLDIEQQTRLHRLHVGDFTRDYRTPILGRLEVKRG